MHSASHLDHVVAGVRHYGRTKDPPTTNRGPGESLRRIRCARIASAYRATRTDASWCWLSMPMAAMVGRSAAIAPAVTAWPASQYGHSDEWASIVDRSSLARRQGFGQRGRHFILLHTPRSNHECDASRSSVSQGCSGRRPLGAEHPAAPILEASEARPHRGGFARLLRRTARQSDGSARRVRTPVAMRAGLERRKEM